VTEVSDDDRDLAFANIKKAAKYYNVELRETNWHELGQTGMANARANDR